MSGINTLLSTVPPAGILIGGAAPSGGAASSGSQSIGQSQAGSAGDVFEQGQWWKNRSRANGGPDEQSGEWRAKAALRAYGVQSGNGLLPSGGGEAAPEEKGEIAGGEAAEGKGGIADSKATAPDGEVLTTGEQQIVARLRARDVQVRAHEQAHLAAVGGYARGGASFQYQRGPDGRKYAVGGEVDIDVSRESNPEQTIRKLRVVRNAALAPADPSAQDRRVASRATNGIFEAQQELAAMREEEETARRDEVMSQVDSSENKRDGGPDAAMSKGEFVNGGKNQLARNYGEAVLYAGSEDWRGIHRVA